MKKISTVKLFFDLVFLLLYFNKKETTENKEF